MKHFYLLIFLFLLNTSGIYSQPQTVDFRVNGLNDTQVTLGYYFGDKRYVVDTLKGVDGVFTMHVDTPQKAGLYFLYSENFYFEFMMDTLDFSIVTEAGRGYESVQVEGSEESEIFRLFRVRLEELQRQQKELMAEMRDGTNEDSLKARTKLEEIDEQVEALRRHIKTTYPKSFTASFVGLMQEPEVPPFESIAEQERRARARYNYYKKHYFDHVDLGDPRLLRTPLLHGRVIKYFDQVTPQHPDSINVAIDRLFEEVGNDEELFRYWLVTLFQKYEQSKIMGMDAVTIHLIENYYLSDMADWISADFEKKLREEVAFVKPNLIGRTAPELNVVDTLFRPVYIEQIDEPYLVLYFYDPDCGHCKKATKALKETYDELTGLGAEVLAICTVTDVEKWKAYIRKNDLPWLHAADPYSESRFRVTYNIRSTPKIYVLGQDRKILAKQLEVGQLTEVIERLQQ